MVVTEQIWRAYIDAWNRHDIDRILELVTGDFIYDERPTTMVHPLRGRSAFRRYLERTFAAIPDLEIEVTSCDAGRELAVSESLMRGTPKVRLACWWRPRGRIATRVACVFEVRQGQLAHERLYWDRANTVRQLGWLPAMMTVAFRPAVPEAALSSGDERPTRPVSPDSSRSNPSIHAS